MSGALPWYVLLLPLVSAAVILLATRRSGGISSIVSVGSAVLGFLLSCLIFSSPDAKAPELIWIDLRPALYVPLGVLLD